METTELRHRHERGRIALNDAERTLAVAAALLRDTPQGPDVRRTWLDVSKVAAVTARAADEPPQVYDVCEKISVVNDRVTVAFLVGGLAAWLVGLFLIIRFFD